jgi:peroxiredoxin
MNKTGIFLFLCILLLPAIGRAGNIYYVDKVNGNDNNTGKNKNTAWKSLNKLNIESFRPGDEVYLKRGQVFEGQLYLKGSGKQNAPIKLGAFGLGNRPVINATGHESAIKVLDDDHWEIADIETTGGTLAGIFVGCTKNGGNLNHFRITNCYVHDIGIGDTLKLNWNLSEYTGGIIIVNGAIDKDRNPLLHNSVFNDVIINDCTVRYNNRWTCISVSSGKIDGESGNANYIRNCITEFSAADGIRMNRVRNSFIEYCVMYRNGAWPKKQGRNLGGLGAWFFDADSCIIQYCEASQVRANTSDGGAFDIDYWQKNSTVQYCYGHDCAGYGVSVFGADSTRPTENSLVQYNILSDNGRDSTFAYEGDFFIFTWDGGLLNGVIIHDNLSIWKPAANAPSLKHDATYTGNNPNTFTNNIIYSDTSWIVYCRNDTLKCDSNVYWVRGSRPIWSDSKSKYYSLPDWQKSSGQDLHSKYSKYNGKIPSWYKYSMPAKQIRKNKKDANIQPGSNAPGFFANTFNGEKINLTDYKGSVVLLCFIDMCRSLQKDTSQIISSQIAFIKSMQRQYGGKGLKIILIDESYFENPTTSADEKLFNFINDRELKNIDLVRDKPEIDMAKKYGVAVSPTTFLISKQGALIEKWENLALPAQLAFAIDGALK